MGVKYVISVERSRSREYMDVELKVHSGLLHVITFKNYRIIGVGTSS